MILLLGPAFQVQFLQAQPTDTATVITRDELRATGRTTLAEALQVLVPSFNAPRPSGGDGGDPVRPASLRGMGADQLVVLVNGKRRHGSALVNLHAKIGRGETVTDLDAIPLAAVERVEILRAPSVRYSSGAVAGVINIVTGSRLPGELIANLGVTSEGDGGTAQVGATYRGQWGAGGFVQLAGEARGGGATNRALPDRREQFFPGDPRNQDPRYANRINHRWGDPESRDYGAAARVGRRFGEAELSGSVAASRRRVESASFWRRPNEDATVRSLYPTGFLPIVVATITEYAADVGGSGPLGGWRWNLSAGYATSRVRFEVENSVNASLGPLSPARFFAGSLGAVQLGTDLELRRVVPVGLPEPLRLAAGGTVRSEAYRIHPGERDSYRYGAVPIQDGPRAGGIAPVGAQGFPGFTPDDSLRRRRESYAGYAEVGLTPLERLRFTGAASLEHFPEPEYGTLPAAVVSGSYGPLTGFTLRGSAGAGFRVPSQGQRWFTRTLIPVVEDLGLYDLLVPATHPIAKALGATPLRPERSGHRSIGLGLRTPRERITLSADYYWIAVRHRIVLTEKFNAPTVRFFLDGQGYGGVGSVQFFANAINTRTTGFEARGRYELSVGDVAVRLDAALDHHRTRVTEVDSIGGVLSQYPGTFFSGRERTRIESGQPGDNLLLSATLRRASWTGTLRARYYGAVRDFGPSPDGTLGQSFGAKWLGDVELSYTREGGLTMAAGAHNLLGAYPDRNNQGDATFEGNSTFGIFPYNSLSPFGFRGRSVYLRAVWQWGRAAVGR